MFIASNHLLLNAQVFVSIHLNQHADSFYFLFFCIQFDRPLQFFKISIFHRNIHTISYFSFFDIFSKIVSFIIQSVFFFCFHSERVNTCIAVRKKKMPHYF